MGGPTRAVEAFLSAARHAGEVLSDARVGAVWDQPSALPRMDVGAVAGHMFLVVRRVDKHLDEQPPVAVPGPGRMPLPRVDTPDDLDQRTHRQVRVDGDHVRAWGWVDVRQAYRERVDTLARRLTGPLPDVVDVGQPIAFDEYIASRVVELLVHADDLAVSALIDPRRPPPDASDVALRYLLVRSREAYGDLELLRAFTRRERTGGTVPFVY